VRGGTSPTYGPAWPVDADHDAETRTELKDKGVESVKTDALLESIGGRRATIICLRTPVAGMQR
jgi:hypothetical protein